MSSKDGDQSTKDMEKPLQGAVLCCTSIPAEQRTHMAEAAIQMGAEHKLDLTSDVTHLIVGDSNTPKYKYVAREREDIKALQLEWVDAVRQAWMRGDDVDLGALEEEYRIPTFAGLKICVTGFEDLAFRAQLQKRISENGGEYRGDLTKEVTHLVAYQPVGKKYQFATQWEIKVVDLKWINDSLLRRMILDETFYHPSIPSDQQGYGAWHRQAEAGMQLGKRSRRDEAVPDLPRKLRRTASAKLGSQSESLWGEIVSGPQPEHPDQLDPRRASMSLPIPKSKVLEQKSFATDTTEIDGESNREIQKGSRAPLLYHENPGIFAGYVFLLHGFTSKQASTLREHLLSNDGESAEILTDLEHIAPSHSAPVFLVVPHDHVSKNTQLVEQSDPALQVVTDLWAERCLLSKRFFHPDGHVLSRPLRVFPIPGFEKLTINTTGLADVDLLHVCKVVKLLGARFDQVLKPGISLLVCNPKKASEDKVRHAWEWRIPSVSVDWLWSCIQSGQVQSFRPFLLQRDHEPQLLRDGAVSKPKKTTNTKSAGAVSVEDRDEPMRQGSRTAQPTIANIAQPSFAPEEGSRMSKSIRGEGFLNSLSGRYNEHPLDRGEIGGGNDLGIVAKEPKIREQSHRHHTRDEVGVAREAISANPVSTSGSPFSQHSTALPEQLNRQTSRSTLQSRAKPVPEADAASVAQVDQLPTHSTSITGAIKELLNKTKMKDTSSALSNGGGRKKRLFGSALSNLSNSSREGSNLHLSRASSIDSVNTEGLGSVILDETSQSRRAHGSTLNRNGSFIGRASVRGRQAQDLSLEFCDSALYREEYLEEEEPPQMTQLGYENPDEAVALREKLVERRRNQSGKAVVEPKRPETRGEERRIKDHVTVSPRRTRQRAKSP